MKSLWQTQQGLLKVFPKGASTFYVWYSIVTGALALLDTAALALIALAITPLATGKPISLPMLGELPASATVWVILVICTLFILKGVLAIALHWYATRRFARYELEVGNHLFKAYSHSSWEDRSRLSTAEVTRIVDLSIANANKGFILPLSQIPTNLFTFVAVLSVLVIAQPVTALTALVYLSLVSGVVMIAVTKRIRTAGLHNRRFGYNVATIMTEVVDALKELTLRGKLDEVGRVVSQNRHRATRARANLSFLSIIPKYVFEAALIGGFLLVGGISYLLDGPQAAVVSIGLFAATGFRLIPAMNGILSGFNLASANEAFAHDVIRELNSAREKHVMEVAERPDPETLPESPNSLRLTDVQFRYPRTDVNVLDDISLEIPFGSQLAIVGPSGAGKSTLVDLLLGLSLPTGGQIAIDEVQLDRVIRQWRGRVGYVPQRVSLFDASIAQNVALTWVDDFDEDRVRWALERAQLTELLERPDDIHDRIGERGSSISGGQQQRLGIARALYSDPLVLVLDEATSALDTGTENRVTMAMRELQGDLTFITIAHRLATIRDYDQVCYLEDGTIQGIGSFDEVVDAVPAFAAQAHLAGLVGPERLKALEKPESHQ